MQRRDVLKCAGAAALLPRSVFADLPSRSDLADDVRILRAALALHPGLYRYNTPVEIDARLDELAERFSAAPDMAARYLLLSRFLATLRCGHSYCNFFNQTPSVAKALFDRPTRLPFTFRWIDGRMIVTRDDSGLAILVPGTEVVKINGIHGNHMLAELMLYARADGHNDAKRRALLEVRGDDAIETFDVFQGLLFPPDGMRHQLEIKSLAGHSMHIEVPAITLAARQAKRAQKPSKGDLPLWSWEMRENGIALLTMPSWALFNSTWDWQAWLTDRLNSLGGAKALVVDLRANEGGNDCGDALLARWAGSDLSFQANEQRLRFQRTPADVDRYLDTWDNSFRTLGVGGKPLGDGFYLRPGQAELSLIKAVKPRITLPTAVLIGAVNSSATFQFAQHVREANFAKLYGSTTGGNRRGINGGCFFFVRLPASGLEFDLPLVGEFPLTPQPDAGLEPDVPVSLTRADIANGHDPVMTSAITDLAHS